MSEEVRLLREGGCGGGGDWGTALKRQEELIYLHPTCWEYNSGDGVNWLHRGTELPPGGQFITCKTSQFMAAGFPLIYPLRSIQVDFGRAPTNFCIVPCFLLSRGFKQMLRMCVNPPGLCLRRSSSSSWCRS